VAKGLTQGANQRMNNISAVNEDIGPHGAPLQPSAPPCELLDRNEAVHFRPHSASTSYRGLRALNTGQHEHKNRCRLNMRSAEGRFGLSGSHSGARRSSPTAQTCKICCSPSSPVLTTSQQGNLHLVSDSLLFIARSIPQVLVGVLGQVASPHSMPLAYSAQCGAHSSSVSMYAAQ
jgi:hypothetical protein